MTRSVRSLILLIGVLVCMALLASSAPALTITSIPPDGHTNANPVVVSYSDPDTLINYACALMRFTEAGAQPPELVPCSSSSVDLGALAEGEYMLSVQALWYYSFCVEYHPIFPDECIALSTSFETRGTEVNFFVDRTAPMVSLSGGPAEGSSSTDTSASFAVTATDGTITCKLDGATIPCGTISNLTGLSVGTHQLTVTATDRAGNADTKARNFTVLGTGGATNPPGSAPPAGGGATTRATPVITSAPRFVKLGKKIKLGVACPDGCRIAIVFSGAGKRLTGSIVVKPGATAVSYSISKSGVRAVRKALRSKKKVTATFTPDGGGSAKKVSVRL